jgi:hypothetical protein
MQKLLYFVVSGVFFLAVAACSVDNNDAEEASELCDRQCLEGFVNQYLDAMVAHDESAAPFSESVKFTENAKEFSFADNTETLWATSTGLGDYKFYVADPQAGQVAFVGIVDEGEQKAILSMRLRIEEDEITEVESVVVRNMKEVPWTMKTPPAAYSEALAPEDRVSREELIRISSVYFDGIVQINSKIVPWHDECYRLENGMWTAGPVLPEELAVNEPESEPAAKLPGPGDSPAFSRGACSTGFDSGVFALIESIEPRRTPVVDEERGVTWGVYMFNHPGVETVTMPDGTTQPAAYFSGQPNSMPMSELFKITGGKIRDIMAIGVVNDYMSGSGWD